MLWIIPTSIFEVGKLETDLGTAWEFLYLSSFIDPTYYMLYYFYWVNGILFSMNWSSTTLFTAMKGNESDINSTYVHTNCMQVINIHENLKRGKFNATLLVEDNFSHSFEAWIYGVVCHCKIKVYSLYILFKPISLSSVRHGVRSRKMVQIVPLTNFKLVIR